MCLCLPSSINWYWRKLRAKQALHATHYSPRLAASAGVWLRVIEAEINGAVLALWLGKDFILFNDILVLQETVGDSLVELWISYNQIEKLKGVNVLKKLKVCDT